MAPHQLRIPVHSCCQSAPSGVTETWPCAECVKQCFNVENRIILSLNIAIPIIIWLSKVT